MAFAHEFEYYRPNNLAEALELLNKFGDKAKLLAGGTDIVVHIKDGLAHPEVVIDIKNVKELERIIITDNSIFIGALATFSDIVESNSIKQDYLLLWECSHSVASVGIRNRATLVGNICSAIPSLDSAPALLCYEAEVHLLSKDGERKVSISDWFVSLRKVNKKDKEIVTGISINKPAGKNSGIYIKLGRYGGEDLAQAGLGILADDNKLYKLAYCAVAPTPQRAKTIEQFLNGKELSPELIESAKAIVEREVSPITDIRASKDYRLHICKVMLERGLFAVKDRLDGKCIDSVKILGG